jgi:hypothetical protein
MASWLSGNVLDIRLTQSNKARIEIDRPGYKNYNNYYITILQQHMTGTKTTTIII